ncbi:hypothetical protein LSTR_LSTR007246 [Laodelphax striatellus]|uniref:Ig-like domain-containing protein n=1 Tax=Laodelphax striatellus TaxID=195883 RepID=A0A482XED6_LAOST|nr:hypothetical protein LSTR_LSTR007246 [Laodelphax striatellus]
MEKKGKRKKEEKITGKGEEKDQEKESKSRGERTRKEIKKKKSEEGGKKRKRKNVATGSGTISHYFTLHVVVPNAYILGNGEYHIGEGSTISLVCIIENSPQPPQYVFWYHNERMVNFDPHSRGSVTVTNEEGNTQSRLLVNRATPADSGNYTCIKHIDKTVMFILIVQLEVWKAVVENSYFYNSNFLYINMKSDNYYAMFYVAFFNVYSNSYVITHDQIIVAVVEL